MMRKLKTKYIDLDKGIMVGTYNHDDYDESAEEVFGLPVEEFVAAISGRSETLFYNDTRVKPKFSYRAFLAEECGLKHISI